MDEFTVLLLRPDTDWDGPQADWVLREHVLAIDPKGAIKVAQEVYAAEYCSTGTVSDDLAPIAVYPGHIVDLYDPTKENDLRLHVISYIQHNVKRREYAASDTEASKRCTALKMADGVDEKPSRQGVEVPTDKAGLLEWLNKNATFAG